MRIAFDLDGVLADMESALIHEAQSVLGDPAPAPPEDPATPAPPSGPQVASTSVPLDGLRLTSRQRSRLWRHVQSIEGFWECLEEIERGAVARLAELASARGWQVIFLTRRPECAGATSQVQTQRWLDAKGFVMPSVFVVQGSRGRIAAALDLDFVIDDLPENCVDVAVESKAKAMLVWRDERRALPAGARRLGIAVVRSVGQALDLLIEIDSLPQEEPSFKDRVMRLLGLKSEPAGA